MIYKKKYTSENDYIIQQYYNNGRIQQVSPNQDLYLSWLDNGNTPEVIPFTPQPPLSFEQKQAIVKQKIIDKQNRSYNAGVTFNGNVFPSNPQYREIMVTGARLGKEAMENSTSLSLSAFTISGTIEILDEDQAVSLLQTYDNYGLSVYNLFMSEMGQLPTVTESQLDYYLENDKFE